tara:strand:+ start:142 stop:522 length:381 start_codon:yes stop_codon:yes gene_type:complete
MKYCQGTNCHEYRTKDRIRGTKGNKSYQTRRRSNFYYGNNNFCSQNCQNDWLKQNIENALNHFGRTTEPKKVMCDNAWYKDYKYNYDNGTSHYQHYFRNDLLGKKISISEQEYNNEELIKPNNLSQ